MTALSIQPTYPIFTDIDGQPLEDGYVWIGAANLDPQTNPINVYWDAALTLPAAQPIRTLAGYPANSGTPARLYVNSDYSIRVMNKNGSVVYSAPAATERYSDVVVSGVNAEDVIYDPPFLGGVQTNAEDKFAQTVSVKDFGAVGDGVADDTAAIQAAFDSGAKSIFVPAGSYLTDALTIPANVMFAGEGTNASKLIFTSGNPGTNDCINMGANCQLRDLYMEPQTKNATYSVLPLLVPTAVFDYSTTIDAPRLAENCSAIGCVFDGFYTGISADSPNVKVDKCVSKGGYAGLNFYAVNGFSITNSQFYGGTYGCVGLPSCKNGRVVGNYLVAPGSTGVNPGGSNAPGFNVENITIADNVVIGTNGVTCELGIESVTITGNVLLIANDNPINGVGVGVATRAGGAQLRNITITGNTVRPLDPAQAYASGINVGNDDPAGPNVPVDGVTITGNIVQGSTQGIVVQALVSLVVGATITGNRVVGGRFGLYLVALKRFAASNNLLDADAPVTIGNYYGVIFGDCVDGIISNNVIKGYGQHFRQVGNNVLGVDIVGNKDIANDDSGAYVQFFNAGASPDSVFKETESMPAAFGLFDGGGAPGAVSPVVQKGVSSINKTATGTYLVSLLKTVGANLPAVFVTVGDSGGAVGAGASVTSITTFSFVVNTYDASGVLADYDRVSFTCIGY